MKEKAKLTRRVSVRFTLQEYNKLETSFKRTTKKKISEYIRFVLLEKPVTVYTRNQSADQLMAELIKLRTELSAIGNNFNQAVKRLHTMSFSAEVKLWAERNENDKKTFLEKVTAINKIIAQLYDKWWQE
ncbi:MAG: plasmid mobilization relaxosome protein MobC [Chitinophagaceae bacterium]